MRCFLDLDGCLVNFVGGVCRLFGVTEAWLNARWPPNTYGMHDALGLPDENYFWNKIDDAGMEFWEDLEWMPDGEDLLKLVETYFPGRVSLMTAPPREPLASAGKMAWIARETPAYRHRFAITPCKEEYAHDRTVLVDDRVDKCIKFIEAGGHSVAVPRRWNDAELSVEEQLRKILGVG